MRGQYILDEEAKRINGKEKLRKQLESDVAKFIKNNPEKDIEMPPAQYVPRQPYKKLQPYPKRPDPTPYKNHKYNKILREWCLVEVGRVTRLAEMISFSASWLSRACSGRIHLRFVDYEQFVAAMAKIEADEQEAKLKNIAKKYTGEGSEEKQASA